MTGLQERTILPRLFPPYNPKCRHCIIRNGVPCCGLFHDMWKCNRNCPYAEYAPVRLLGRMRVTFAIIGC